MAYRGIDDAQAKRFLTAAERGRAAIVRYLDRPYDRRLTVAINDSFKFPQFDRDTGTILIPASRIRGDSSGPAALHGRGPAIVAVMTRAIAPSRNRHWGEFLETGLGVFLQEKFGGKGDRSFPNMGQDLHEETARMVAEFGRFIPLREAERERRVTTRFRRARRLAHLEEGSFVRFLIESKGLESFLRFYDGKSMEQIYGADLETLESAWKSMILALEVRAGE